MPKVGSQNPQARDGGSWKAWSRFWARHNGSWKRPVSVFVKSGGSWVEVWDEAPSVSNISTQVVDFGTGSYFNYKYFTLTANGFATTVTVDGNLQSTEAADSVTSHTAVRFSDYYGDYPSVTVANSSGSVTF